MITIIAAMDMNRVIGADNALPWNIPEDLQHFKKTTLGYPIIMGRKTYESLPHRPLPRRQNIVVSRSLAELPGARIAETLQEAIDIGRSLSDEVFVIGGEAIYELAMPMADRLLLTIVKGTYPGNKFFPIVDLTDWKLKDCILPSVEFSIMEYHRIKTIP